MMVSVRMVIVSVVVGHGVADRSASDAPHDRADRPSHDRPDNGAADPARDRARFGGQGKRG